MVWLVNPVYTHSVPLSTSNHTHPHSNECNYNWGYCLVMCWVNVKADDWLDKTQFAASCHWRNCHGNFPSPSINHLKTCGCIYVSNWRLNILRQKTLILTTVQRSVKDWEMSTLATGSFSMKIKCTFRSHFIRITLHQVLCGPAYAEEGNLTGHMITAFH